MKTNLEFVKEAQRYNRINVLNNGKVQEGKHEVRKLYK